MKHVVVDSGCDHRLTSYKKVYYRKSLVGVGAKCEICNEDLGKTDPGIHSASTQPLPPEPPPAYMDPSTTDNDNVFGYTVVGLAFSVLIILVAWLLIGG